MVALSIFFLEYEKAGDEACFFKLCNEITVAKN